MYTQLLSSIYSFTIVNFPIIYLGFQTVKERENIFKLVKYKITNIYWEGSRAGVVYEIAFYSLSLSLKLTAFSLKTIIVINKVHFIKQ